MVCETLAAYVSLLHSVSVHASCRRFPFVLSLSAFVCLSENVNVVVYVYVFALILGCK